MFFLCLLLWVTASNGQTYTFGRTNLTVGPGAFSAATGDFNGDGIPDIVSVNQGDNTVSVLAGNLYGGFSSQVSYPTGPAPSSIVIGDFNNDGNLDLAVADANCVNVADMNGVLTLVCSPGMLSVLLGNGDGTFQPHLDYATGKEPSSLLTGDFNGDGNLDLATANVNDGSVSVLLGQGDGTFQPQAVYTVAGAQTLVVGDFNNDHKLDLAVAAHTVVTLLGKGDGTFLAPLADASPLEAYDIASADFNLDGKLDLYVGGNVFLGKGDGTFVFNAILTPPSGLASAVSVDLNGDAKPDLVLAEGNGLSVLFGNGDGTFQTAVQYAVSYYPAIPYAEPPYPPMCSWPMSMGMGNWICWWPNRGALPSAVPRPGRPIFLFCLVSVMALSPE